MKIIINGKTKNFKDGITIFELLCELSLTDKVMASAVNMDIVKQDKWNTYILKDGDRLELLDFVGGG